MYVNDNSEYFWELENYDSDNPNTHFFKKVSKKIRSRIKNIVLPNSGISYTNGAKREEEHTRNQTRDLTNFAFLHLAIINPSLRFFPIWIGEISWEEPETFKQINCHVSIMYSYPENPSSDISLLDDYWPSRMSLKSYVSNVSMLLKRQAVCLNLPYASLMPTPSHSNPDNRVYFDNLLEYLETYDLSAYAPFNTLSKQEVNFGMVLSVFSRRLVGAIYVDYPIPKIFCRE